MDLIELESHQNNHHLIIKILNDDNLNYIINAIDDFDDKLLITKSIIDIETQSINHQNQHKLLA